MGGIQLLDQVQMGSHSGLCRRGFALSARFRSGLIIGLCLLSMVLAAAEGEYRAAVAEHDVFVSSDGNDLLGDVSLNLDLYEELISVSKENHAHIVVFPEFGLNAFETNKDRSNLQQVAVSVPPEGTVPCDTEQGDPGILRRMSCSARTNGISVLINVVSQIDCTPLDNSSSALVDSLEGKPATECPEDGKFLFNTNVVFNERGEVAATYYKSHEWFPLMPAYNQPAVPDNATYVPAWGPASGFGIFTCFDIMWSTPAVSTYIDEMGLNHFLYPVQQGGFGEKTVIPHWSKKHSTTILSSNLGDKKVHDASAIYTNGKELEHEKIFLPAPKLTRKRLGSDSEDFEKLRSKENVKIANVAF